MAQIHNHIIVANAKFEDIPEIAQLARLANFDIGQHCLEIYFRTCPGAVWRILRDSRTGDLIGYDILHVMPSGTAQGYQTVVRPDYRMLGLAITYFIPEWPKYTNDRIMVGSMTGTSLKIPEWSKNGIFGFKLAEMSGILDTTVLANLPPSSSKLTIKDYSEEQFGHVNLYDELICPENRKSFLKEWCKFVPNKMKTVTAWLNGQIVGYGTLVRTDRDTGFCPLYANSSTIAACMIQKLVSSLPPKTYVWTDLDAGNRNAILLFRQLGLKITATEMRVYTGNGSKLLRDSLKTDKVFGLHDIWLI